MKSKATCLVSAEDYREHWQGRPMVETLSTTSWDGIERRSERFTATKDRRQRAHDRRWENCRGRRFRVADRRKS